jgi:epoxyqueuosine reductase
MTADEIRRKAAELGFGDVGFTGIEPFSGWAGEMARRIETEPSMRAVWEGYPIAADPLSVMPGARTVIVLIRPFAPYTGEWPEGYLRWSAYYECREPARKAVGALVKWLATQGIKAVEANDRVPLKEATVRSGLGRIGLHQLLITPQWGSNIHLCAVLIDREIKEEREAQKPLPCETCRRCVEACPTGALEMDGTFHRERCLRHYMLSGELIPEKYRYLLGKDLVGCERCQTVCPRNHGQHRGERVPDAAMLEPFSIQGILDEWETGLKARMGRMAPVIGANYARARKVLGAALIASKGEKGITEAVGRAIKHPHPHIRRYAAWALSFQAAREAGGMLKRALADEVDEGVREEIKAALDRRAGAGKNNGTTD